nr:MULTISPECIES: lipoprotein insertase outer membrane protein LolB [unclassified Psychrosphaera]
MSRYTLILKFLTSVLLVNILVACSLMPKTNIKNIADMQTAAELSHWTARGKMMIATNNEKVSGYFYWQQKGDNFEFSLNTLIGINMFELSVNDDEAELTIDGKTYYGHTAEILVAQLTGYQLPISQLRFWVLGVQQSTEQSTKNNLKTKTKLDEKGRLKHIEVFHGDAIWQIDYQSWRSVMQFDLPKSLQLKSPNNRIKLSITDWALQG